MWPCIECKEKLADKKPRVYRDTRDDKTYTGVRMMCSDECEDKYIARMKEEWPTTDSFERVE